MLRGTVGERWLTSRFEHYRHLHETDQTVINPEIFEKRQAEAMNMSVCAAPVDVFPVAVSRYMSPGRYCFIDKETIWYHDGHEKEKSGKTVYKRGRLGEDCTPSDQTIKDHVNKNLCPGSHGD